MGDKYPVVKIAAVQAASVFLNREATIDKLERIVKEAKDNGADLVCFPESYVPCFPSWVFVLPPIDQHSFFKRIFENAVEVPGEAFYRLSNIAKKYKVFLSVGVTEKSNYSLGAMWNTNLIFDRDGKMISKHRKIMPTWAEKLCHNFGDGSGLVVHDTEIGRLGALICGENTNTLARYSMIAQGEQIHVATYPACGTIFRATGEEKDGYNIAEIIHTRAAAHAFEAKVYVAACSGVLDQEAIDEIAGKDMALKEYLETKAAPPATMIVGPNGEYMAEPLVGKEGIVYAECDISAEIPLKGVHDLVGSYQRFDIFNFKVNRTPAKVMTFCAEGEPDEIVGNYMNQPQDQMDNTEIDTDNL